ncbi:hypothetical protein OGAPHI_003052 [Ogataea philodendri]|uniref:Dolichyl-phosphate-mannose--protein mannosyltransferase n=1 Tax=Ogataea philodendri TaxID=1378263 RepID=A0A9P8P7W7_9ASCO|nr:uncharacterized protein OGAPHI_003052 [Ogataea philodendri]KAH3667403.1 hypothetical protein OGAPHI_003052 [Ogataea philodendri]
MAKKSVKLAPSATDKTTELRIQTGPKRQYLLSTLTPETLANRRVISSSEKGLVLLLAVFASVLRLRHLNFPDSVVFDEVHFGGFARKYILGKFFMDVHPPLAKLLFAAVGALGGFNGKFEFAKIGDVFPSNVPYVLMRQLSAVLSVGTVVLLYLTLRTTGAKPIVAFLSSALLVLENANVTISRFVLLDSPLLFFIAATAYSASKLNIETPLSWNWWKSLVLTGTCLGFACSSKWVGLFTLVWVGAATAIKFWFSVGDLQQSPKSIVKQNIIKFVTLLVIPAIIYLISFQVHLSLLDQEGDGAAFLSSAFRTSFKDTTVPKSTLADVGVGSVVTLKHVETNGGYLHSHNSLYEGGSGQQQVTLYPHLDANNKWRIELYNVSEPPTSFEPILDGTKIRLYHTLTHRRLHSHDIRPSVSEIDWQNEASCYGYEGFEGDPNDDFVVEIARDLSVPGDAQDTVKAIDTIFRLRHAMTGCYLFSHETKLPKWGFEQQEVTCAGQGIKPLSYWYIEQNENEFLDPAVAEKVSYKDLTFFQKVKELHKIMWKINKGLKAPHVFESRPESWPFLQRGISYWKEGDRQVYLLGNPVVWWLSSFLFVPFGFFIAWNVLKWQLGYTLPQNPAVFNYALNTAIFLVGWFIHYYPSFLMDRQMFLHHYLPALYFGILTLGQTLEVIYSGVFPRRKYVALALFVAIFSLAAYNFVQRTAIVYGSSWDQTACAESKMLNWDYDCGIYPIAGSPESFTPKDEL